MSTQSVYKPHADAGHVFPESDPLGDASPLHSPTYSVSKIAEEAVARTCARAFGLPITIARMNASYGPNGGLPAYHLDAVVAGEPVTARHDPAPYRPIHQDDINAQIGPLLEAASVPATIVNWAGDEVVTVQQWCAYVGSLIGTTARGQRRGRSGHERRLHRRCHPATVDHRPLLGALERRHARHPGRAAPRGRPRAALTGRLLGSPAGAGVRTASGPWPVAQSAASERAAGSGL